MTNIKKFSPAMSVENPTASSNFYIKHFNAKVTFDCGWYINIAFGNRELCFMKPQSPEQPMLDGKGLMYNFEIENVDEEYSRLSKFGVTVVMPLEDHPWGDRGFGILDPHGIVLYFYKSTEPTEEFKQYYKNI
jgi:uncharacterized glyoxalase superfamily protein PhnB